MVPKAIIWLIGNGDEEGVRVGSGDSVEDGVSHSERGSNNDRGWSDKDDKDNKCNILSPATASIVKSPLKKKRGVKVMNLPKIDKSHLNLEYDNLVFGGIIDGLD